MFRNDDNILNAIHEQKESHLKLVKEMGELGSTVKKNLGVLRKPIDNPNGAYYFIQRHNSV